MASDAERKYEFTGETLDFGGVTLNRIRATRAFGVVRKGEVGGWIERDGGELAGNLDHAGGCWVSGEAKVFGLCARVTDEGQVSGEAIVTGRSRVLGLVTDHAYVAGGADLVVIAPSGVVAGHARAVQGRVLSELALEPKYELTDQALDHEGVLLHRIRALQRLSGVEPGALGGWVEGHHNLDHEGDCWISDEAKAFGQARVTGAARLLDQSQICDEAIADERAEIRGAAIVEERSRVDGDATVSERALVSGSSRVSGRSSVYGSAYVAGGEICDEAEVTENSRILGSPVVAGNSRVRGRATVMDNALIEGSVVITDRAIVRDRAIVSGYELTIGGDRRLERDAIERGGDDDQSQLPRAARAEIERFKEAALEAFATRRDAVDVAIAKTNEALRRADEADATPAERAEAARAASSFALEADELWRDAAEIHADDLAERLRSDCRPFGEHLSEDEIRETRAAMTAAPPDLESLHAAVRRAEDEVEEETARQRAAPLVRPAVGMRPV